MADEKRDKITNAIDGTIAALGNLLDLADELAPYQVRRIMALSVRAADLGDHSSPGTYGPMGPAVDAARARS